MTINTSHRTILIRDLPGCTKLEDTFLLKSGPRGQDSDWAIDAAHQFGREHFDIDGREVRFERDLTDDEIVELLLKRGIDFRDMRGQPLLCTRALGAIAVIAAEGLAGRMPDASAFAEKHMEDRLRGQAEAFQRRQKGARR